MKIALEFTYYTDIIDVPTSMGKEIQKYQKKFDSWLYDKENEHGNWVLRDGKKVAVSFDTDTFVDYLNSICLYDSDEKVVVLEKNATKIPKEIKTLFF